MTLASLLGLAGLLALGKKLVDFARMLTNWGTQRSGAATQAAAWAVFVGLVFLYGAAQTGARIDLVPGLSLSDLNGWAKVILGLQLGSGAGLAADYLQSRDNHDSQALPPLRLPRPASLRAHPAEGLRGQGGPVLPDAAVMVRPVLDLTGVQAATARIASQLSEAVGAALDAAAAAADAAAKASTPSTPPPSPAPTNDPAVEPTAETSGP